MNRLAIIDAESRRFAEVLAHTPPDARCPTCPDWTAADLLWHLTEVHLFWAAVLFRNVTAEDGVAAVEQSKPSRPDSVADLLALREGATSVLLAELSRLDDAEPRWSWFPSDQTVGFTRRMQTYEALMHRVDAELAAGLPIGAIAADVAAGAVDHAVDVMWAWQPEGSHFEGAAVVEFVATDTAQRWQVDVGAAGDWPSAVRSPDTQVVIASATVRGTAADLALWAWNRGGSVDTSGEPASLQALDAVVARGMP
ncbi:maleylpyruvate isomerase family mycothiol-dependent enzyme [Mycolicibacterium smegmatis]|uniref:maleylpyruvate isomerase family mycothiol-dependent enzyme n=1 Tax=Mycolicibacterium smegmatis TaxID=1772 RepID=UPI0005DA297B|nr:maleylpyruvate isomerase family mycothiol-dependent enzyme [Mycolicibacterium smegmatis]MDF1900119.1 maleylpyruvate isomerase family mycothiol-dependent enzyme [Mycolicibacterium smegmatis]MDF1905294.1 maleylpyruvate isomerase family mycothiol-dependent enzyme [Mycolicibacterium smegmatis]MDF1916010.1 maleylpyruvate isomerase family mycothiol-dependent enzyme [Mycolicibacterium smegmatis]MDF1923506.1 maleylpyruvate isomerase family mycothiol-dependent enzyme [Mycolicibacterium smegmatis]UAK